jgi:predicted DNA-binding protein (MmcQ/YjbR family)
VSAPTRKLTKAEAAIRAFALGYPGAHEEHPWGECAIKINGKVFLFLGQPAEGGIRFTMKLPVSASSALELPFSEPTGYGLSKHGWVTATFAKSEDVPLDLIRDWIDESFRAVAPKAVLAHLESAETKPAAKPAKRKKPPQSKPKPGRYTDS